MHPTHMRHESTPFPTLDFGELQAWEWPAQPFAWRHLPPPNDSTAQPCRIETASGTAVQGEMLEFDPVAGHLGFRSSADSPSVCLAFARFRRLTLLAPLRAAPQIRGAPAERVPAAAQVRAYTLHPAHPGRAPALTGFTAGHVETDAGLYLFTPVDDEAGLERVFVPRSAYSRCEFGPSAEEVAARLWCAVPSELLAAIERQRRMPVLRIGQSLLALGLLTQTQLDRALARMSGDLPLGEALVADGLISHADLQTALAHKMGYPFVDLSRFPVDPSALARLPPGAAERHRVLPLMLDKEKLIVAVDNPSRVTQLQALQSYTQTIIVPVLAHRVQILHALKLNDLWRQHAHDRPGFQPTLL
jgi:hypothetical protein